MTDFSKLQKLTPEEIAAIPPEKPDPDYIQRNAVWAAKAQAPYVLAEEIKRRNAAVEALKAFVSYEPWMDNHADDVQVSTFKRHTFGDLRRAMEAINSQPTPMWECAALKQGTAGGNDPADCNWPTCGCDPHADRVMEARRMAHYRSRRTIKCGHQ